MDKKRILVVVEDDADMQHLIRALLSEDAAFDIVGETADADATLDLVKMGTPDLIVLDHYIDGPLMGLDLAPLVKQAAPGVKILLFSAHDLKVEAGNEPAIDAFVLKSNFEQLVPTIKKILAP